MEELKTYFATIHVGLKEGYEGKVHNVEEVYQLCQEYADINPTCVSVTETMFIYHKGNEPGVRVEFINYPRFPKDETSIHSQAEVLGQRLAEEFKQIRYSISDPYGTITYKTVGDIE